MDRDPDKLKKKLLELKARVKFLERELAIARGEKVEALAMVRGLEAAHKKTVIELESAKIDAETLNAVIGGQGKKINLLASQL